jgi:hypothetical protein
VTYSVGDRQYLAVSVGQAVNTAGYLLITPEIRPSSHNALYVFALPAGWQTTKIAPGAGSAPLAAAPALPGASSTTPALGGAAAAGASPALSSAGSNAAAPNTQCHRTGQKTAKLGATADRTFSPSQVAQGKKLYVEQQCALCHGATMLGSAGAPALADSGFRTAWQGHSLGDLFDCLKNTMPPGRAGALDDADYARLLAAILDANGIPAGGTDAVLPADSAKLKGIGLGPTH